MHHGTTRVEVLGLCFDFENRATAVLLLKFRGREAILSQAQSQIIPNLGRESKHIQIGSRKLKQRSKKSKHRPSTTKTYLILAEKVET